MMWVGEGGEMKKIGSSPGLDFENILKFLMPPQHAPGQNAYVLYFFTLTGA